MYLHPNVLRKLFELPSVRYDQIFINNKHFLGYVKPSRNNEYIELKIWHGNKRHEDGERQISEYLEYFGLDTGYMLSFNFNKKKETGVKPVPIGDKILYEGTV